MRKVNIVVVLHGRDVNLVSQLVRVLSIPSFQTVMRRSHTHTCTHAHTHTHVCVCVCVLVRAIICGKIWHSYNMYVHFT